MSSTTYSTDLVPDAVARHIVLGTGAAALAAGILALAVLPVDAAWRLAAAGCWAAFGGRDLWLMTAAYKRCRRYRLDPQGGVQILTTDGCCVAATLGAGSVVLWSIAWLRFEVENGRPHAELLRLKTAQNKDRRLQVIWRHLGA